MYCTGPSCRLRLFAHKLAWVVFAWLLVGISVSGQAAVALAPALAAKNILLLYSYGPGGEGVGVFDEALLATLREDGISTNQLYGEYLDLERNLANPHYATHLEQVLKEKYAAHHIDLIITVQQPAGNWVLKEGRDFAPRAPVIMIQGPYIKSDDAVARRVISVNSHFDAAGTVRQAQAMFPGTQRVLLVSGTSEADQKADAAVKQVLDGLGPGLQVERSGDLPLAAYCSFYPVQPRRCRSRHQRGGGRATADSGQQCSGIRTV